ncbi:MAG: hypothetical protein ACRD3F_08190, partial [Acidobacteriaceae bacterium]
MLAEMPSAKQKKRHRISGLSIMAAALLPLLLAGCRRHHFPQYPANYREFAYITNSGSNTVTVLDLVHLRQDRTLQVGD